MRKWIGCLILLLGVIGSGVRAGDASPDGDGRRLLELYTHGGDQAIWTRSTAKADIAVLYKAMKQSAAPDQRRKIVTDILCLEYGRTHYVNRCNISRSDNQALLDELVADMVSTPDDGIAGVIARGLRENFQLKLVARHENSLRALLHRYQEHPFRGGKSILYLYSLLPNCRETFFQRCLTRMIGPEENLWIRVMKARHGDHDAEGKVIHYVETFGETVFDENLISALSYVNTRRMKQFLLCGLSSNRIIPIVGSVPEMGWRLDTLCASTLLKMAALEDHYLMHEDQLHYPDEQLDIIRDWYFETDHLACDQPVDTSLKPELATLMLQLELSADWPVPPVTQRFTPQVKISNRLGMEFVHIEPGTFLMGSPLSETGRDKRECLHRVTLSHGYFLQTTEVTQAQWRQVMGSNPSRFPGDDRPVENVSWSEVQAFIGKLNARIPGWTYRLPTEAEWEHACRAGTTMPYYWGRDMDGSCCWYGPNSDFRTHPVASTRANAWGLYDMSGNVFEWCEDWYEEYSIGAVADPKGAGSGLRKVVRGGAWCYDEKQCRSAFRAASEPDMQCGFYGFRLVLVTGAD